MKYLTNIDLNQNELQNGVLQNLASDPAASGLKEGQIWINTSSHKLKYFDGTNIITIGEITVDSSLSSTSTNPVQNKVINTALGNKVDKETGKGLSTNDYTTTEKNKLAGIASGAEVNVQSDWNVTDSSSDAFIKNKPTIPAGVSPATATPLMDGTGAVGSSGKFAREDHVHPTDTSRASASDLQDLESTVINSYALKEDVVSKLQKIDGVSLGNSSNIDHYGTCITPQDTAAKVATLSGNGTFALATGALVFIKMTYANMVSEPTLNVGGTGAKRIKRYGTTDPGANAKTSWNAGSVVPFMYDGTYWQMIGWLNNDTTYTAATAAPGKVASASSQGSSTNYARQDHTHGIDLATGDSNGQVKIAGTNVSVKGLSDAAYKGVDTSIASGSTSTNVPTSAAVASFVGDAVGAVDAMRFKGTIGTGGTVTTLPTSGVKVGDTYRVITAGTYAGQTCEIGDLIIAIATTPTWTVAQTNIDGAITSISGTSPISVTGSGSSRTIAHENSGVTAASKGDTSNQTPGFGNTFKALSGTVNATGHLTAFAEHSVRIPDDEATASVHGLMSAADKSKLNGITAGIKIYKETNPPILPTSGLATWRLEHVDANNYPISVTIYEVATGNQVIADVKKNQAFIDIEIISSATIAAGTYVAEIILCDVS